MLVVAATINLNAVCYAPPTPNELPKREIKQVEAIDLKLNKNNPLAITSEPDNTFKIVAGKSNAELEAERVEAERLENERLAREAEAEQAARAVRQTKSARTTTKSGTRRQTVNYGYGRNACSCVIYARETTGIQVRGYAGAIRPNSYSPVVGGLALTRSYGHVAVVTGISGNYITVREANYSPCRITTRTVSRSEFRGYYN